MDKILIYEQGSDFGLVLYLLNGSKKQTVKL